MSNTGGTSIEEFRSVLEKHHADFIFALPAQDECAHVRFIGTFNDKPVIWDATIMTLAYYNTLAANAGRETSGSQFIDIGQASGDTRTIEIGLELDRIDEQAVLKTIIMIRKYKRLHTGRHEFGYTSLLR
jgi:hypothetical protein